jgi:2-aminoadipate transaminase
MQPRHDRTAVESHQHQIKRKTAERSLRGEFWYDCPNDLARLAKEHRMSTPTKERHELAELFAARAREDRPAQVWPDGPSGVISLSYGFAAPEMFPVEGFSNAAAEVLTEDTDGALNYGDSYHGLIELLTDRLQRQGMAVQPGQVLITYGSSQVLALLPQILVDPGDVVIVEGPTFMGAVKNFLIGGAKLVTVPVDAHGMDMDALEATLREHAARGVRPKFIYTIPTFQNPSGTDMPLDRRRRLVALAEEYGVLVVEDDAYGDLRFEGEPKPRLAALSSEWVLHVGTFSKIMAPGLRMGWAAGPKVIVDRLRFFKLEGSSGPFMTRMVERFGADGRLDAHIAELNACYRRKRDLMLETIAREFPGDISAPKPDGGFFIWAKLPAGLSAQAIARQAEQLGVAFVPGTGFYANGQGDDAMRLAFSYQSEARIVEAITRLGKAIRAVRG